jgi:hypothetical protein
MILNLGEVMLRSVSYIRNSSVLGHAANPQQTEVKMSQDCQRFGPLAALAFHYDKVNLHVRARAYAEAVIAERQHCRRVLISAQL